MRAIILIYIELVSPVWYFTVQHIKGEGEDWVPEEPQSKCEGDYLDDPVTRCE